MLLLGSGGAEAPSAAPAGLAPDRVDRPSADATGSPVRPTRGGPAGAASRVNAEVAGALDEVARRLEARRENPFRVSAWRRAAGTLRDLDADLDLLLRARGPEALESLPGIGTALAHAIAELVATGRLGVLDRLRAEADPEALFESLPGVGPELARRIHERLGIDSLEELELAAWNGRLDRVPGFGRRRVEALRSVLDDRLGGRGRRAAARGAPTGGSSLTTDEEPTVSDLLSVDAEYRLKADAGALRLIAPRRFNPKGVAWLPVLDTRRGDRSFRALYSNTLDAHRLARTHDWVVVAWEDEGGHRGQATVVTERRGELAGQRVVRGREDACRRLYADRLT